MNFLLFGGGKILVQYGQWLKEEKNIEVSVLASDRHLEEVLPSGDTLRTSLEQAKISYQEVDKLTPSVLQGLSIDLNSTHAISFGAPWIVRQEVLDLLENRIFNVHGSRLPQDRGGGGFSWRLMQGSCYGFALIHRLDAGIDTGDIVKLKEFLFEGKRIPREFDQATRENSLLLLKDFTEDIVDRRPFSIISQPDYFSSYWPRLNTQIHGAVDWSWTGEEILRFVCAFDDPYPGAFTLLNGKRVHLKNVAFDTKDGAFHPFQAGIIYRISSDYAAVSTKTGTLLIQEFYDDREVKVPLSELKLGDRLFSPRELLEAAMQTRVVYTPSGMKSSKLNQDQNVVKEDSPAP